MNNEQYSNHEQQEDIVFPEPQGVEGWRFFDFSPEAKKRISFFFENLKNNKIGLDSFSPEDDANDIGEKALSYLMRDLATQCQKVLVIQERDFFSEQIKKALSEMREEA